MLLPSNFFLEHDLRKSKRKFLLKVIVKCMKTNFLICYSFDKVNVDTTLKLSTAVTDCIVR